MHFQSVCTFNVLIQLNKSYSVQNSGWHFKSNGLDGDDLNKIWNETS